ncbi:cohesin domain-containing protein [Desulfobacterales bacterium HSG2]|nr:cohesin domain-containing protein [Desulfobacterales bacterium HSG2]
MQYTMTIHARVQVDGQFIEANGSKLAAFKNGKCRGVEAIQQGPVEKWFQVSIASNKTAESDFALKVYDAASDQVYCILESFNFVIDKTVGLINMPQIYIAETCPEIGATVRISPEIVYLDHDAAGRTFDVNITIEDAADLGAFQFNINYDPAIVSIEQDSHVVLGAFLGSTGRTAEKFIEIDNNSEKLTFVAITSGENAGPEGEGVLGKITFTVKDLPETDSTLSLSDVELTNASGPPFSVLLVDEISGAVIKKSIIPTYTIRAIAEGHGDIHPSGNITVPQGESRTFNISPEGCYHIEDVQTDSVSVGDVSSYTFADVNKDHTIKAVFDVNRHIIGAGAGDNGNISPSGNVNVNCGSNQVFTITPKNECYRIEDVLADDVSVGPVSSHEFKNVTENHTIEAAFAIKECAVTPVAGAGGIVSPSEAVTVDCGSNRVFNIIPDMCYDIEQVMINNESKGAVNSYTFECNDSGDYTIEPAFAPVSSCVTEASTSDGGSIEPSGTVTTDCGSSKIFTIMPDEFHHILDVEIDGESMGAVNSYTLECDGIGTGNHTIAADFTSCACTMEVIGKDGGSISPSGTVTFSCGSDKTFIITPDECYDIKNVTVDGESKGAVSSYLFKCDDSGNHTIEADFILKSCIIEVNTDEGGSISPSGTVPVNCGTEQIFTITPDECYDIKDVIMDEQSKTAISSYRFECDGAENHTMTATFNLKSLLGDINQNNEIDLKDAILTLQVLVGSMTSFMTVNKEDDINEDGRIGIEEVIYILRQLQTDGNETADLKDAILILKLISGGNMESIDEFTTCMDIKKDGKLGIEELIYILQVIAGLSETTR